MNLYKVWQTKIRDYDTYAEMVVCAKDEQHARSIHPSDTDFPGTNHWDNGSWCASPEDAQVEYLGEARIKLSAGVICSSLNTRW